MIKVHYSLKGKLHLLLRVSLTQSLQFKFGYFFQGENPVSLAIGTQVSAKYKGAFCEAKVRSVIKEVKCRVTFKGGLGSCTLSDDAIKSVDEQPLIQGANVKAMHPDKQEYLDAVINQIKVS